MVDFQLNYNIHDIYTKSSFHIARADRGAGMALWFSSNVIVCMTL